ncbi:MAG: T9SS type A sorting domain-containing protein [Bacteroidia bacterium]|nr:T9SS type A sorting domain-containing protein [Bacteroidia bacterium]
MKKQLLVAFLLIAIQTQAQFVDFNFNSNWSGANGNPMGWASAKLVVPNIVVKDSVIAHYGSSAKITTSDVSSIAGFTNGLVPPHSGLLLTGSIGFSNPPVSLGYPFTQRTDSLGFFARYEPSGVDTGFAQVILYKRQAVAPFKRDTIAFGYTKIEPTGPNFILKYVEVEYDPNFPSSTIPDSALIIFSSSMISGAQLGSTLWVDDIQWGTINTGQIELSNNNTEIFVSPNPANDYLFIDLGKYTSAVRLDITDISGKLIESININNRQKYISVAHLANGLYLYQVQDINNGKLAKGKLVVKH